MGLEICKLKVLKDVFTWISSFIIIKLLWFYKYFSNNKKIKSKSQTEHKTILLEKKIEWSYLKAFFYDFRIIY